MSLPTLIPTRRRRHRATWRHIPQPRPRVSVRAIVAAIADLAVIALVAYAIFTLAFAPTGFGS